MFLLLSIANRINLILCIMDQKYITLKNELETILYNVNQNNIILYDQNSGDSLPENYTINCFFKEEDLHLVKEMIERLRQVDDNQFYYSPEQLHITLLGQIDIKSDLQEIINIVSSFIKNHEIVFDLLGVGSSVKVASVTAYPHFAIDTLRGQLRQIGGGTSFDGPYEKLAWINFMRYLNKSETVLKSLVKETNTNFGTVKPERIELLRNSSRLLVGAEVVHTFR